MNLSSSLWRWVTGLAFSAMCATAVLEAAERAGEANALEFPPDTHAPFLGLFSHVEAPVDFKEKLASLNRAIASNPHLAGFTLKIRWSQLHPERDRWDWAGLEALIAAAHKAGKLVNLAIIPGAASPDWIYGEGVRKAGPLPFGKMSAYVPLPWDEKFVVLFANDLKALAARYADDPRVFQIEVLGHNYNNSGEEMHAPPIEAMKPYGWTREKALANWIFWIDCYAGLFPKKRLSLVISQMYGGGDGDLPLLVAEHFVQKCQGRAVLQTHQLNGREDGIPASGEICRRFAALAPNCHEVVGSFMEQPARQGTAAMTIYNARKMGDNLLYIQLWRRDVNDVAYAQALVDAWKKYGLVPLGELKARLIQDGAYIEKSDWVPVGATSSATSSGKNTK